MRKISFLSSSALFDRSLAFLILFFYFSFARLLTAELRRSNGEE